MDPWKRNLAIFLTGAAAATGGGWLGYEEGNNRAKPYESVAPVAQRCAGQIIRKLGGNEPLVIIDPQDIEALPGCEQLITEPMPTPLIHYETDKAGRRLTVFERPRFIQRRSEDYRATADQLRADFTSAGIKGNTILWAIGASLLAGTFARRKSTNP